MVFAESGDAKKRLEEAKARLREEKRRLKEEMRKSKSRSSHHSDFTLKPWMIWDIGIIILVIILFSVSMYYPRPVMEATEVVVEEPGGTEVITTTESDSEISGIVVEDASGIVVEEEEEATTTEKAPEYTLVLEDEEGNELSELVTTANVYRYNVVIKNLESEFLVCDGDRIIDDDRDEEYYKGVRLHPGEKEEITTDVLLAKGKRTEVKYEIRCRFYDGIKEGKIVSEFDITYQEADPLVP